ncbi:MAG: tetratricopeptide repeat protein [Myxococcota bacterium]
MSEPANLEELIDVANDALDRGDLATARQAVRQAEQLAPDDRDVLLVKALMWAGLNRADDAFAAVDRALEQNPDDLVLLMTRASFLMELRDDALEALPLLEEVAQDLREAPPPDDEQAAEVYRELVVQALLQLSECRAMLEDATGALDAAQEALEVDPGNALAHATVAASHFELNQLDEAESAAREALQRQPDLPDALWVLGRVHNARGRLAEADAALQKAAQQDPNRFHPPTRVDNATFQRMVDDAINEMPRPLQTYLRKVALQVEDVPSAAVLTEGFPVLSPGILAHAEGEPPDSALVEDIWSHVPRALHLYRRNLEVTAPNAEELRELVATSLAFEVGRFLGLDTDEPDASA